VVAWKEGKARYVVMRDKDFEHEAEWPRVHLSNEELRARLDALTRRSLWIDYPAELGLKAGARHRPWPKVLDVGTDGRGLLENLLSAINEAMPVWKEDINRHVREQNAQKALNDSHSPGWRVLGRENIARYLGISEDQLSERRRNSVIWSGRLHKIGWMLVSDAGLLDELDCIRQVAESRQGRNAQAARKRKSGGRKPLAKRARG
jgi:hypothetical protein